MVMGSVLLMEGVGLGLARNIVQRYALETGSEQGKADDASARWAVAGYMVTDAKRVGDIQKRRFNGDAFAVSLYIDHVVILQVSLLREAS
jgi:hypothetical protein